MPDEVMIRFRLIGEEASALKQMCYDEHRKPWQQIRHILHAALVRQGYLDDSHQKLGIDKETQNVV